MDKMKISSVLFRRCLGKYSLWWLWNRLLSTYGAGQFVPKVVIFVVELTVYVYGAWNSDVAFNYTRDYFAGKFRLFHGTLLGEGDEEFHVGTFQKFIRYYDDQAMTAICNHIHDGSVLDHPTN